MPLDSSHERLLNLGTRSVAFWKGFAITQKYGFVPHVLVEETLSLSTALAGGLSKTGREFRRGTCCGSSSHSPRGMTIEYGLENEMSSS